MAHVNARLFLYLGLQLRLLLSWLRRGLNLSR
jgi:hypothetical protein